jgi:UDP-GlcNAc3NAcA epimerase
MITVLTVVGARPQFVKAAVFSRYVRKPENAGEIKEILVHTGQHYDKNMSEVFFTEMDIPTPDVNLGIGSGRHGAMTAAMLVRIEDLILERKPDILLVYGDTNSTLAGALAASKLHVPIAHVEAGLRSNMKAMPEEQNRILADHLSTWLFCPTSTAINNLRKEGICDQGAAVPTADHRCVTNVGDIMLEASNYYRRSAIERASGILRDIPDGFILLTVHRAENTDDLSRLRSIVEAINGLSGKSIVFPIHPRTRKVLDAQGLSFGPHVRLLDPVSYFEMICLEDACSCVVTDSGGVQKEAFFFSKPCVTLRDSTEWVELVDSGWNTLVGGDKDAIISAVSNICTPDTRPNLYGTGNTAELVGRRLLLNT